MATEEGSLTPQEQAKLKTFAQALPDNPGEIDVDAIAQETGTSRRQVLQVIAAVGVGSIAGGVSVSQLVSEAQAQASTSDGDGNVGTPADRVDVFADGIDASVIDAESLVIGGTLYEEDDNSPIDVTDTTSSTYTLSESSNKVIIIPDGSSDFAGFDQLQVNGSTGGNYDYLDNGDAKSSGQTAFQHEFWYQLQKITIAGQVGNHVHVSFQNGTSNQGATVFGLNDSITPPINSFTVSDSGGTPRDAKARVYRRVMNVWAHSIEHTTFPTSGISAQLTICAYANA